MRRKLGAVLLGLAGLAGAANYATSAVGGCIATTAISAAELCSSNSASLGGGVTQFGYQFGINGFVDPAPVIAIPLLDANAIVPGSLAVTGGLTASVVTDAAQVDALWDFVTSDPAKEAFETPAALIVISGFLPFSGFFVSFNSDNPVVDGPIRTDFTYIDPPLPGAAPAAVPEPATLALLGFGLAGLAAVRRRRG